MAKRIKNVTRNRTASITNSGASISNTSETAFRINRIKKIQEMYVDEPSVQRRYDQTVRYNATTYADAAAVRQALRDAITNNETIIESSRQLYAINPIYQAVIDYLSNMYMWRYKVTPHKIYTKSKAKRRKATDAENYGLIYSQMLEIVDGLSIEIKFPTLLTNLFINGSVYFTTLYEEESMTINTLILPSDKCRKVGETQYGTAVIRFDFSYFQNLGLDNDDLQELLKMFPKDFRSKYNKYLSNSTDYQWQTLDARFSSGILLNEVAIPTLFYLYGGILDYEQYQDNELERNENLLKYLVVQKMPIYQDKLVFEMDEVQALHQSMRKIIDRGEKSRLVTTFGDVNIQKISDADKTVNQVLDNAFKAIFNNAGFNAGLFTSDSVTALQMSLIRDKGRVWRYVQALTNFYTIAINNWFDFKDYQADIDILPISPYTYNDDLEVYKTNATLGVAKLDYLIAAGIKQKNLSDQFELEKFLKLEDITPMQTSFTQSAEDRVDEEASKEKADNKEGTSSSSSEVEPSEESSSEDSTNI